MAKIYPINMSIYHSLRVDGLIYSEIELEEIKQFCKERNLYFAICYRDEELQLTDESNNTETTIDT
jgi:hypothetical protein